MTVSATTSSLDFVPLASAANAGQCISDKKCAKFDLALLIDILYNWKVWDMDISIQLLKTLYKWKKYL